MNGSQRSAKFAHRPYTDDYNAACRYNGMFCPISPIIIGFMKHRSNPAMNQSDVERVRSYGKKKNSLCEWRSKFLGYRASNQNSERRYHSTFRTWAALQCIYRFWYASHAEMTLRVAERLLSKSPRTANEEQGGIACGRHAHWKLRFGPPLACCSCMCKRAKQ